jgi:hypothetical protein
LDKSIRSSVLDKAIRKTSVLIRIMRRGTSPIRRRSVAIHVSNRESAFAMPK